MFSLGGCAPFFLGKMQSCAGGVCADAQLGVRLVVQLLRAFHGGRGSPRGRVWPPLGLRLLVGGNAAAAPRIPWWEGESEGAGLAPPRPQAARETVQNASKSIHFEAFSAQGPETVHRGGGSGAPSAAGSPRNRPEWAQIGPFRSIFQPGPGNRPEWAQIGPFRSIFGPGPGNRPEWDQIEPFRSIFGLGPGNRPEWAQIGPFRSIFDPPGGVNLGLNYGKTSLAA